MPLQKVSPALFAVIYREIGVKIAVLVLGGGDKADKLVRLPFKRGVTAERKRIRGGLEPFVSVAVLENHSAESVPCVLAPERSPGVYEILRHMAFLHATGFVPQHAVLVGNDRAAYDVLIFFDESRRFVCGHWYLFLRFHILPPGVLTTFHICIIIFPNPGLNGETYSSYGK